MNLPGFLAGSLLGLPEFLTGSLLGLQGFLVGSVLGFPGFLGPPLPPGLPEFSIMTMDMFSDQNGVQSPVCEVSGAVSYCQLHER